MHEESRKRSVDNLQRVYTVVISLAIAESLRRLLSQFGDTGQLPEYAAIMAVISLIITVVPFYHGANRYLDSTYVTGERSAKSGALMLDFVAIFVEGLVFFVLSILIQNTTIFFTLLAVLFLFDSFWVWLTRLTSNSQADKGAEYRTWAIVNIVAALFLLISFWSNLFQWSFWPSPTIQVTAAFIAVLTRTISDYWTVWNFYYPPPPNTKYIMPIPRPALAPTREERDEGPMSNNRTTSVLINYDKAKQLVSILRSTSIPAEQETAEHTFTWEKDQDRLANCFLAIVAICHQTSPIGEMPLQGIVNGKERRGWDYLKEKFLLEANRDDNLTLPEFWQIIYPNQLSDLYSDDKYGLTLNRINERCYLLNDLGMWLSRHDYQTVSEAFKACNETICGDNGFIALLKKCEAYADPLAKKALFFITLAVNECHWFVRDPQNLLSPIDYHELRGHLRIGTVTVNDPILAQKLQFSLPITQYEDLLLREAVQQANDWIASEAGISNSVLHYLFWNVFRNCCSRSSQESHCTRCSDKCMLPKRYKNLSIYKGQCFFAHICSASNQSVKFVDPPYFGHYY